MKIDRTRDYTTDIFRVWMTAGCPAYGQERARVRSIAMRKYAHLDAAKAHELVDRAEEQATPYLLDVLAAEATIHSLEDGGRGYIADAVRAVYCSGKYMTHKDISGRVRRFAREAHADERTVYRWLREARCLCAVYRGLYDGK